MRTHRLRLLLPLCCCAVLLVAQSPETDTLPELLFSIEGGFYPDAQTLELIAPGGQVYFTDDGTRPEVRSAFLYRRPIQLRETTVIKAFAVRKGQRSPTVAHTYFVHEPDTDFPTVSVTVPPHVLFDPEEGLFVSKAENDSIRFDAVENFWTRREFSIHTEIYEADGSCVFRSATGMRLFGGVSRTFPQKSLVLVADKKYGQKRFKHPIWGAEGPKNPKFLVLRNSGSDFGKSHFRDAYMTSLVEDWDLDKQASRPAHVYLNGRYWGVYNIREKVNRYFLRHHDRIHDKDSVDLLEHRYYVKRGGRRNYVDLLRWMRRTDFSDPAAYAQLRDRIDVDNFLDLQLAQIFFDNRDAGGNIKFYRAWDEDSRWRWVLYDTDWGFGMHSASAYRNRSLAFFTRDDGPDWPNPPWSTFILRKLLENEDFRAQFVVRFCDRMNTDFRTERTLARLKEFVDRYAPEMPRHMRRWNLGRRYRQKHLDRMREFAEKRPAYITEEVQEFFEAGELRHLRLASTSGGHVVLNDNLRLESGDSITGDWFDRYPLRVRAVPRLGYRFVGWAGERTYPADMEIPFELLNDTTELVAVFEPHVHPLRGEILLNELSVNNRTSGDWLEIYNYADHAVDLTGWRFTDLNNEYVFPQATVPARDYIVVCRDSSKFKRVHPAAHRLLGGMDFGLNKRREVLALYSDDGAVVDSFSYELAPTDSAFTLNLLLPHLDNGDFDNWEILPGNGTPLNANPYYVTSTLAARRQAWVQSGLAAAVLLMAVFALFWRERRPDLAKGR